jgi:MFS family permease
VTLSRRLYLSSFINSFGSWMTFLALALITQERYGSRYVAIVFLIQSLPAILFSRGLARLVPEGWHERVYLLAQVGLCLNSLMLVFNQSLVLIFAHLLTGAFLKALSGPVFNTLAGQWVVPERQREVFTRLGALQASTLSLAPILGAWLKIAFSVQVLFAFDALSFLISLAFLSELFRPLGKAIWTRVDLRSAMTELVRKPEGLPSETQNILLAWFAFLIVGAILNAIEFPGFQLHQLSEQEIGYALAAWGVGNLLAFLQPRSWHHAWLGVVYMLALVLFLVPGGLSLVVASFALAGALSAYFAGSIRARLQATVPDARQSMQMWAYVSQVTQVINLVAYASAAALLSIFGFYTFAAVMLVAGAALIWLSFREMPPPRWR